MKNFKKFLAAGIAFCLLMTALCVPASADAPVLIPLSSANTVAVDPNNYLTALDVFSRVYDGDSATNWNSNAVWGTIDLGGYYDLSSINLNYASGWQNFSIFASANLADVLGKTVNDRTSEFCIYTASNGQTANITVSSFKNSVLGVRYVTIARGNGSVKDFSFYATLASEATDAPIQLGSAIVLDTKSQYNNDMSAYAGPLTDGIFNAAAANWNINNGGYIIYDLGQRYSISAVEMYATSYNTPAVSYFAGENATTFSSDAFAVQTITNANTLGTDKVMLEEPVTTRYLKIMMSDRSPEMRELRLFGAAAAAAAATNTVTFEPNNGSATTDVVVESGGAFGNRIPANPTKDDYFFAGWYYLDAENAEQPFSATTVINSDLAVYAKYDAARTVTFDADNGTANQTVQTRNGAAFGNQIPADPIKTGSAFSGWFYVDGEGIEQEFSAETVINTDLAVYAKWSVSRTVTFMNGETEYAVVTDLASGTAIGARMPEKPVIDPSTEYGVPDRAFVDWITANGSVVNSETPISANTTLYARYASKIDLGAEPTLLTTHVSTITNPVANFFDNNTTTYHNEYGKNTVTIDLGGYYSVPYIQVYKRTDMYTRGVVEAYVGANLDNMVKIIDEHNDAYMGGEFMVDGNNYDVEQVRYVTIIHDDKSGAEVAIYGERQSVENYTVNFVCPGQNYDPLTIERGSVVTMPQDPEKEGNIFLGWYTDADFINAFDPATQIFGDTTLYARFAEELTIASSYIAIDGIPPETDISNMFDKAYHSYVDSGDNRSIAIDLGMSYDLAYVELSFEGHQGTTATPPVIELADNAEFNNAVSATLAYELSDTVTYIDSEGNEKEISYKKYAGALNAKGVRYMRITVPEKTETWFFYRTAEIELYGDALTGTELYTVSYDLNGGTGTTPASQNLYTGNTVVFPLSVDAEYTGYRFVGWTIDQATNEISTSYIMTESPVTVYAVWEEITQQTLTLVYYDGTTSTYNDIPGATFALTPSARTGFIFAGWFTENGTEYDGDTYTFIDSDETLTEKWNFSATAAVRIDGEANAAAGTVSGINIAGYTFGTNAILLAVPAEGYTFVGWFEKRGGNDVMISDSTALRAAVTKNAAFYAEFKETGKNTVFFVAPSGWITEMKSVAGDTAIGTMPSPVAYGYAFSGWYTATKGGTEITAETVLTGDITVFAQFTPANKEFTVTVTGGTVNGEAEVSLGFLETAILVPTDVENFNHWEDENGNILSYSASFSFEAKNNAVISAISGTADAAPVTSLVQADIDTDNLLITFIVGRELPANCTLIDAGVLLLKGSDNTASLNFLNDLSITDSNVIKASSAYGFAQGTAIQSVKVSDVNQSIAIRSYMIYSDAEGNTNVCYSKGFVGSIATIDVEPDITF